jgi:hypothetical protein
VVYSRYCRVLSTVPCAEIFSLCTELFTQVCVQHPVQRDEAQYGMQGTAPCALCSAQKDANDRIDRVQNPVPRVHHGKVHRQFFGGSLNNLLH